MQIVKKVEAGSGVVFCDGDHCEVVPRETSEKVNNNNDFDSIKIEWTPEFLLSQNLNKIQDEKLTYFFTEFLKVFPDSLKCVCGSKILIEEIKEYQIKLKCDQHHYFKYEKGNELLYCLVKRNQTQIQDKEHNFSPTLKCPVCQSGVVLFGKDRNFDLYFCRSQNHGTYARLIELEKKKDAN